MEAAVELFSESGYTSTGMEEIGAAVGITAGGLYRHFRSKHDILREITTRATDEVVTRVQSIAAGARSPEEVLAGLVDNLSRTILANRALLRVYWGERRYLDPTARSSVDRAHRLHVAEWTHVLSTLRPDLSDAERATLVEAVFGAMLRSTEYDAGLGDERLYQLHRVIAMNILQPVPAQGGGTDSESGTQEEER